MSLWCWRELLSSAIQPLSTGNEVKCIAKGCQDTGYTLHSWDLISEPLQCFTNTALFRCNTKQHSAVSHTWHSWRGFEELAVEMLNHHITFLSGFHPERPRGSKRGRKREIFRRFVTSLTLRNDLALNLFCKSSDIFNTNLKLHIMMLVMQCIFYVRL